MEFSNWRVTFQVDLKMSSHGELTGLGPEWQSTFEQSHIAKDVGSQSNVELKHIYLDLRSACFLRCLNRYSQPVFLQESNFSMSFRTSKAYTARRTSASSTRSKPRSSISVNITCRSLLLQVITSSTLSLYGRRYPKTSLTGSHMCSSRSTRTKVSALPIRGATTPACSSPSLLSSVSVRGDP